MVEQHFMTLEVGFYLVTFIYVSNLDEKCASSVLAGASLVDFFFTVVRGSMSN